MPKYKEYFQRMLEQNEKLFEDFAEIHHKYQTNDERWQEEFNKKGAEVMEVIREWENKLCLHSEGGQYAKYAGRLAEKFQELVKKEFPLIDHVGLKINKFSIKRINPV